MNTNTYFIVGNWDFSACEKGLHVYRYNGGQEKQELVEKVAPDVTVGQQYYDPQKHILYLTHESDTQRDGQGAGGSIMAFRVDPCTGRLSLIKECPSLGTKPSYVWRDSKGDYLLVSNHSGRSAVTKIVRDGEGHYKPVRRYDDTTLVLYSLNQDGEPADACDVLYYTGTNEPGLHTRSQLHSVAADPTGELYVVCDTGLDRIYTLRIDRERGRLLPLSEVRTEDGSGPRYTAFHPTLPIVYVNHEEKPYLSSYCYDRQSGTLAWLERKPLLDERVSPRDMPSDIAVSPDGTTLYASVRGADQIVVFRLDERGHMARIQTTSCGGKTPRGIAISPDGKYLLSANQDSGFVSLLPIQQDGTLGEVQSSVQAQCPGCIAFVQG